MGIPVVTGATLVCTMGLAPGQLLVTSQIAVSASGRPMATISDASPMANVTPCGMCTSMMNPTVASATAAALGVLSPMPCIPATMGGWICGGTITAAGQPILTNEGSLTCMYGGSISILNPGQATVTT